VLSIAPDDGECSTDAIFGLCRIVRVTAPADGTMTVEALSTQPAAEQPQVAVCCVSGNERDGNPLTMPVTARTAYYEVQIGLSRGITTSQSVLLKTSFAPLWVPYPVRHVWQGANMAWFKRILATNSRRRLHLPTKLAGPSAISTILRAARIRLTTFALHSPVTFFAVDSPP